MHGRLSAFESIGPAYRRIGEILFRPFNAGHWLILGLLSFLQLLGGGGGGGGFGNGFRLGRQAEGEQFQEEMRQGASWMSEHWPIVAVLGFILLLIALVVAVVFAWLSARATFCYIDAIATGRVQIARPWKEHGKLADSYFFWRILLWLVTIPIALLLAIPFLVAMWTMLTTQGEISIARALFGSLVVFLSALALALFMIAMGLVQLFLSDVVAPIQYIRGLACSAAVREGLQIVGANLGAVLLYVLMRLLFALGFTVAVILIGCGTCCIGFCVMAIPVIGQAFLQPYYVFVRAYSLAFVSGAGPGYDLLPPIAPAPVPGGYPPSQSFEPPAGSPPSQTIEAQVLHGGLDPEPQGESFTPRWRPDPPVTESPATPDRPEAGPSGDSPPSDPDKRD